MDLNGNLLPEERATLKRGDLVIYQTPRMPNEIRAPVWNVQKDGHIVTLGNGSKMATSSDHLRMASFEGQPETGPGDPVPGETVPEYVHVPLPPRRSVTSPAEDPDSAEKSAPVPPAGVPLRTPSSEEAGSAGDSQAPHKGTPEYRAVWTDIVRRIKSLQDSGLFIPDAVARVAQDSPVRVTVPAYKRWNTELMRTGEVPPSRQSAHAYRRLLRTSAAKEDETDPKTLQAELDEARRAGAALSKVVEQHDAERKKLEAEIRDLKSQLQMAPSRMAAVPVHDAVKYAQTSLEAFMKRSQPGQTAAGSERRDVESTGMDRESRLIEVMKAVIALYESR